MNEVAVAKLRITVPARWLASMRQQLREIWRRPALRPFVVFRPADHAVIFCRLWWETRRSRR
jgi:hypothetical protein